MSLGPFTASSKIWWGRTRSARTAPTMLMFPRRRARAAPRDGNLFSRNSRSLQRTQHARWTEVDAVPGAPHVLGPVERGVGHLRNQPKQVRKLLSGDPWRKAALSTLDVKGALRFDNVDFSSPRDSFARFQKQPAAQIGHRLTIRTSQLLPAVASLSFGSSQLLRSVIA